MMIRLTLGKAWVAAKKKVARETKMILVPISILLADNCPPASTLNQGVRWEKGITNLSIKGQGSQSRK